MPFTNVDKLVWNFRCSNMDLSQYSFQSRIVFYLLRMLAKVPALIVINSHDGRKFHEKVGFRPNGWNTIPNGVDTNKFKSFKKDSRYTAILEHVPYEHGREYVESIQQYEIDKNLIESFKENDKIGGANIIEYDEPFGMISPSTLRLSLIHI